MSTAKSTALAAVSEPSVPTTIVLSIFLSLPRTASRPMLAPPASEETNEQASVGATARRGTFPRRDRGRRDPDSRPVGRLRRLRRLRPDVRGLRDRGQQAPVPD